ncbi:N-acetylmuramoyl-L-alanine amidase [Virgibacillus subterraneus]|uniref:N-acetylmuramoyl-L-alanine amidase n=2 Tax=Virgibacillus TaxID=84406 RepID=A0A1H0Y0K2_9BACI|nr:MULTISPECIES: cell wall hydrolase [Virgibacillus]SDQ08653.1 N-acetylmuramoyl-L-alanine amidase [Virgibacillus salinus]SEP65135.1 N-acetylmuramoyl-L-alanine amidase [Virgibacillus subterraneus]
MAVVKATNYHINLLARLLRAEAVGEGKLGMLHVGAVTVNRARVDCSDFEGLRTLPQVINQPTAYEALQHGTFYKRARESEKRLARRVINGERRWPAKYSLWYFRPPADCPATWYDQPIVGRYKLHCFYEPTADECSEVYSTW